MVALPLRLPTASYGGHMGHFLLSVLTLTGSAPFSNNDEREWQLARTADRGAFGLCRSIEAIDQSNDDAALVVEFPTATQ